VRFEPASPPTKIRFEVLSRQRITPVDLSYEMTCRNFEAVSMFRFSPMVGGMKKSRPGGDGSLPLSKELLQWVEKLDHGTDKYRPGDVVGGY
jgi:hypothetical protein